MNRVWIATAAVVAGSLVAEVVVGPSAHAELWWHGVPLFDFVYGLGGSVVIVLVSKWLGKTFLQRDESYYEDEAAR